MTIKAFIFPGQGGQFVGQGKAWAESRPDIRDLFSMADEVTGREISRLCFEGPIEELSLTINLQPAVITVGLAASKLFLSKREQPSFAAGHSLGEFGALCLAGVLTESEVLKTVSLRAELMQKASMVNPGIMAAIMNLSPSMVEGICELARAEGTVVAANFNTPNQTVVSGTVRAVTAAVKLAQAKGGRAITLPVSGAFHSPLMGDCATTFADTIRDLDFQPPRFPVVPNALGTPVDDPDELKNLLIDQMTSPVHWVKTVESLVEAGVTSFAECWPRPFLGGLISKCLPSGSEITVGCVPK
jgi:[acyl-carrier-protein] S-malonyltransferase